MIHIPVLFNDAEDAYLELAAISANNFAILTKDGKSDQITCTLSVDRNRINNMVQDLEKSRYSQLRILANRVIVEADSRYKSASPRKYRDNSRDS